MVDEFSNFARMPKPVFRAENVHEIARQALFLHEVAHPGITFTLQPPLGEFTDGLRPPPARTGADERREEWRWKPLKAGVIAASTASPAIASNCGSTMKTIT